MLVGRFLVVFALGVPAATAILAQTSVTPTLLDDGRRLIAQLKLEPTANVVMNELGELRDFTLPHRRSPIVDGERGTRCGHTRGILASWNRAWMTHPEAIRALLASSRRVQTGHPPWTDIGDRADHAENNARPMFDHRANWVAKVRNVSRLGSQTVWLRTLALVFVDSSRFRQDRYPERSQKIGGMGRMENRPQRKRFGVKVAVFRMPK